MRNLVFSFRAYLCLFFVAFSWTVLAQNETNGNPPPPIGIDDGQETNPSGGKRGLFFDEVDFEGLGHSINGGEQIILDGGDTIVFGQVSRNFRLGGHIYQSEGGADLVLARYDESGALMWFWQFGGLGDETPVGMMRTDDDGMVVYGRFESNLSIGRFEYQSLGARDLFLARFSADGELEWSYQIGSPHDLDMMIADSDDDLLRFSVTELQMNRHSSGDWLVRTPVKKVHFLFTPDGQKLEQSVDSTP
jgi:hypothetical protein